MEAGQTRRESHLKVVTNTVDQKAFPLPEKIVVMADDRYTRFSDQFGQGKAEWNIQWNREDIFGDQQFEIIFLDELIETILEIAPQFMDAMCDLRWAGRGPVGNIRNFLNIFMKKMGLRHNKTNFLRLVGLTCEVVNALAQPFQHLCPFARFQRNAIGAAEPSGHKANAMPGQMGRTLHAIHVLSFRSWSAGSMKLL